MADLKMLKHGLLNLSILTIITLVASSCATDTSKSDKSISSLATGTVTSKPLSISSSEREKYRKAIAALDNGQLEQAKNIFSEISDANPSLAGPYTNIALIHYKNKKYVDSFKLTEKAIKLNPKQAEAYNLRGQLNIAAGKVHDAKKDYREAIKLKPDYANAQYNLALVYDIYLQEIELAIKHYEIYMSLLKSPDEPTKEWISHLKGTLKDE